jgi:hypothetical protein
MRRGAQNGRKGFAESERGDEKRASRNILTFPPFQSVPFSFSPSLFLISLSHSFLKSPLPLPYFLLPLSFSFFISLPFSHSPISPCHHFLYLLQFLRSPSLSLSLLFLFSSSFSFCPVLFLFKCLYLEYRHSLHCSISLAFSITVIYFSTAFSPFLFLPRQRNSPLCI